MLDFVSTLQLPLEMLCSDKVNSFGPRLYYFQGSLVIATEKHVPLIHSLLQVQNEQWGSKAIFRAPATPTLKQ